jgi:energy-coupling factor transporter transmembrane protein EcfT
MPQTDPSLADLKSLVFPLIVAVLHAADHIANATPACTITGENRKRILDGSLRTADDIWAALEARDAGATP